MNEKLLCRKCKTPLDVSKTKGRNPVYCSAGCRKNAELDKRKLKRGFQGIASTLRAMGEDAAASHMASNPDWTLSLVETYLPEPEGRTELDLFDQLLELLHRGMGFQLTRSQDTPLASNRDIDYAEVTGDWSPMLADTLESMTWQRAKKFKPDLREFNLV